MSKALTFEEFRKKAMSKVGVDGREYWDAARLGMIPEDEAVRIPDVGEWPKDTTGIAWYWTYMSEEEERSNGGFDGFISRPTPSWTPKVGDAVFFKSIGDIKHIGIVQEVTVTQVVVAYDSMLISMSLEAVKPFSVEAIGKPWGEI